MPVATSQDVTFRTFDGSDVGACLALPASEGRSPALLLIHEIWGLDAHIRDVASRYSREGFVVVAPHLYSRPGQKELLTPENLQKAMSRVWSMPPEKRRDQKAMAEMVASAEGIDGEVLRLTVGSGQARSEVFLKDLDSALGYLRSLPSVDPDRVGATGFCMGGGLTFQLAANGAVKAAVVFYGQSPVPIDLIQKLNAPVLAFYAGEDVGLNAGLPELLGAIVKHRKGIEMKVYPGTMHAFFNDTRKSYNEEAAKDAWLRAVSFFKRNLA